MDALRCLPAKLIMNSINDKRHEHFQDKVGVLASPRAGFVSLGMLAGDSTPRIRCGWLPLIVSALSQNRSWGRMNGAGTASPSGGTGCARWYCE